jgi:hypothetical protein
MPDARETFLGGKTLRFRRYMSSVIVPSTIIWPLTDKKTELLSRVETTPALPS